MYINCLHLTSAQLEDTKLLRANLAVVLFTELSFVYAGKYI